MAGVKGAVISGSIPSFSSFANDTIPKEYHRKVLKKIAQLTKVVHNLNTKLDDSESELQCLKSQHEKELQFIEEEKSTKVKLWEEERTLVAILQTQITSLEAEKEKLNQEKEASIGELEHRVQQHQSQLKEAMETLSHAKSQLATHEKDLTNLENISNKLRHELKDTKEKSDEEIGCLNHKYSSVVEANEKAVKQLKKEHERALKELTERKEKELLELRESLAKEQDGLLQNEMEAYRLSFEKLRNDFAERESELKGQLSFLSSDLSTVQDKLAVADQRNRDLEKDLALRNKSSQAIDEMLRERVRELAEVKSELNIFKEKSASVVEKCAQQKEEMKSMTVRIGELEAVCVSQEHDLSDLCNEIKSLSENCEKLEVEKMKSLQNAEDSASDASQKILKLEKQLEYVAQEKCELRAQFAREIEASRSQLSQRKTNLEESHFKTLEEMRERHSQELAALVKENEETLSQLQQQLDNQKSTELSSLDHKYSKSMAELSKSLSDKTEELRTIRASQQSLIDVLAEKEKLLDSSKSRIDQLTHDLSFCGDSLCSVRGERDTLKGDVIQLELSLGDLNQQLTATAAGHKEELAATEARVRGEMEEFWSSKLQMEILSLREELQRQNDEISKAALKKMVDIKDTALKSAQDNWLKEKATLSEKMKFLENEITDIQLSSKAALDEAETYARCQITQLKKELDSSKESGTTAIEGLMAKHKEEKDRLNKEHEKDKKLQADAMSKSHKKEIDELTKAHHLSTIALKTKLEKEKEQALSNREHSYQEQQILFEKRYISEQQDALAKLKSAYVNRLEEQKEESSLALRKANREIENQKTTIETLSKDSEEKKLLYTRERERGEKLAVEQRELKSQLEVRSQEVTTAKQEMQSLLKLKEETLTAAHRAEVDSIVSQHRHQSQILFNDFMKAKHLLTTKLEEKERRLQDAVQRYMKREARPEDVEMIQKLKEMVSQQETRIKELITEKKVCEMELVNREKNYNKIFNASPLVGVMNPLQMHQGGQVDRQKKSKEAVSNSQSSIGSNSLITESLPTLTRSTSRLSLHSNPRTIGSVGKVKDHHLLEDIATGKQLKFLSSSDTLSEHKPKKDLVKRITLNDRKLRHTHTAASFPPNTTGIVHVAQ